MAQQRPLNGAGHQPDRGTYDCVACEKPWPCHPAREHLLGSAAQWAVGPEKPQAGRKR